ncbi:MAG TPA: multicopper oxidase domain-containing protein [Acidimicrobiales bacterium]
MQKTDTQRAADIGVLGAILAIVALVVAVIAVGFSVTNDDGDGGGGAVAAGGSGATTTTTKVVLGDLFIEPASITAPAGATLEVTNTGKTPHNLRVVEAGIASPMLAAGESGQLVLGDLAPGTYALHCDVPGHAEAGMTGELTVTAAGAGDAGTGDDDHAGGHGDMSWQEMDAAMLERNSSFPAKTDGEGAVELAPAVVGGVKQWDLTAKVVEWETEPGKKVEAWTYNGIVPGPTLRADVGDRVRIVLKNDLRESTGLHVHGVSKLPNSMDGVPDITQKPIKPGDSFTYEFTVTEPAVAMYHSHHNATKQVGNGMLGAILVGQVGLPAGTGTVTQEIPLILNDTGTIGFSLNGKSFPATKPYTAKIGDRLLVHYMNEGVAGHPMHLHGMPGTLVARDGFPSPPQQLDTVQVNPGERVSVLYEITEPGVWAWHCHILPHAEREDGMFGMVTALIVE